MFALYRLTFGRSVRYFYCYHHAEQMGRALALNGTAYRIESV